MPAHVAIAAQEAIVVICAIEGTNEVCVRPYCATKYVLIRIEGKVTATNHLLDISYCRLGTAR
jgi:hypothetical protein